MSGLSSCSNKKNTASNRFFHSFNTRYNVYFNANENYKKALKSLNEGYKDNYTEFLPMYPVSSIYKDKETLLQNEEKQIEENTNTTIKNQTTASQGSWDYTIEKCQKAIKLHSITQKPPKKRGQRGNTAYQELMSRNEYNPFLHNAWLLMGKAQFYKGQFLTASTTFNFTARNFAHDKDVAAEASIWAARCYEELGWLYDAEDVLEKLNNDGLPQSQNAWFSSINADYLLKQNKYREALPYLITAAKHADTKLQKARMTFLLGQVYTELDEPEKAYDAYGKVPGMNPPYELEFNARIRQSEVYPGNNPSKILGMLNRMAKSSKNQDYLDQVYYAIGNIYLSQKDTVKAISNYRLGAEKSTRNGMEKAVLLITLGDVYFKQREYVEAQPCYSEAISIIQKGYKDYDRVSKLSETLDGLVDYVKEVHLQDSLQYLAQLPEDARLNVINKVIADLEKKEKEEKERAEREMRLEENRAMASEKAIGGGGGGNVGPALTGADRSFYFYNPTALTNGKNEFQRKWGRRKLEDDWRRRDKSATYGDIAQLENIEDQEAAQQQTAPGETPKEGAQPERTDASDNPKDVNYYLQQIPLLPEQLDKSNALIADGLFNMGLIYKNKLEDYPISIETFNKLDTRFPDNEYRLEAYYNMFLMYLKMGDRAMADVYKNKLATTFPQSDYAIAVSDPNFEYNIQMMEHMQDSLYSSTYTAYLNGEINTVRNNYEAAKNKYPLSKLMPKFMFLDALTYVTTGDADKFKEILKDIIEKYPDSDVNQLAGDMLKGLARGRQLAKGSKTRGMLWNMRLGTGDEISFSEGDSIPEVFNPDPNVPYLMAIVYPTGDINTNELLFAVASYNFENILTKNFDLETFSFNDISMVLIKNFVNFEEITQYYRMILTNPSIAEFMREAQPLLISESNFNQLTAGYSIAEYMEFYKTNFGKEVPVKMNEKLLEEETEPEEEEIKIEEKIEAETPKPEKQEEKQETPEPEKTPVTPETDNGEIKIPFPIEMPQISTDTIKQSVNDPIRQINDDIENVFETIDEQKEDITRKAKQKWNDLIYGKPELTEEEKEEDERIEAITKQEKEEQKALKKEAEEKAKAERKVQQDKEKAEKQVQKDKENEAKQAERDRIKAEKDAQKAAEQAKKDAVKEKEDLRKNALKEKERLRKEKEAERKAKEKERKELMKQKEREREERLREKERQRKEAQRQKEEERRNRDSQRDTQRSVRSTR